MKNRKSFSRSTKLTGTLGAAALLLAAGCSGGSNSTDSTSGASSDEPVTIELWSRVDGEIYVNALAAAYSEQHENVEVKTTILPNADLTKKLSSALSTGDVPDVVAIDVAATPFFAEAGVLEPLSDRLESLEFADSLLDSQLTAATYAGETYALPFAADTSLLFWNKDLFTEAGIDPEAAPSTWDEFAAAAKAVSDLGDDYTGYHFSGGCGGCAAFVLAPMVWAAGGDFLDYSQGDVAQPAFDSPEVIDLVTKLQDMVADGSITTSSQVDAGENYGGQFEAGQLGMVASGSFLLTQMFENPPSFELGVAPLPGKNEGEIAAFAGGDVIAIPQGAPNTEAAWEFLTWATGDAAQTLLAEMGFTPIRTDLYDSIYAAKGPEYEALANATLSGHVPATVHFTSLFSDPNGPMVSLMQSGVFGTDAQAAAARAQEMAREIVPAP